jgi:hypothetical protein
VPQLTVEVCRSAQPVGQQVAPVEQTCPLQAHAPFEQASGVEQVVAQAPQWLLSLFRSTQVPATTSQQVLGAAHGDGPHGQLPVSEQPLPAQQSPPAPQASLPLHAQRPLTQVSPGLQARPHAPQLNGSLVRSRQPTSGQQVLALVHAAPPAQAQAAPTQVSPVGAQALPQAPQFLRLVFTLMQVSPQHCSSLLQNAPPQR